MLRLFSKQPPWCGVDGLVHGGIIALLLDEVAQWTLIGRHAQFGITREISLRYLRPVPTNTELTVEARVFSQDENASQADN